MGITVRGCPEVLLLGDIGLLPCSVRVGVSMSSGYTTGHHTLRPIVLRSDPLACCSRRGVSPKVAADCLESREDEAVAMGSERMLVGEAGRDLKGRQSSRVRFPNLGDSWMFPSESYDARVLLKTMFKLSVEVLRGV
jgi:hypothetical protein